MKKLLAALVASAFATVAFAQDKMKTETKKAEATKPYGNTPTENKAPAAAPATDTAPAAKGDKAMMKGDKATKDAKKEARAEQQKEEMKKDVKKP